MGNELLSVLNTVMAAIAAVMNLWGALRTSVPTRRTIRMVVVMISLYVGAMYTAYLLDMIVAVDLGTIYLRPAMLVFLVVMAILPVIDLLDPVERLREETNRLVADLRAKYEILQEQMSMVLARLGEAQIEVKRLRDQIASQVAAANPPRLLIAVGNLAFDVDLAVLRKVQRVTGLIFARISPATKAQLERKLERDRAKGTPVRWLHLSVHAGHEGAELDDGLASWAWLSEILSGVEVLVIAGCRSDWGADALGIVPYVVSFTEDLQNQDAALFAEAFWTSMAQQNDPSVALEYALDRCPPVVREFVERSW